MNIKAGRGHAPSAHFFIGFRSLDLASAGFDALIPLLTFLGQIVAASGEVVVDSALVLSESIMLHFGVFGIDGKFAGLYEPCHYLRFLLIREGRDHVKVRIVGDL